MKNEVALDTTLATDLTIPLLAYVELLRQGGAYAQSRLLLTLVEDVNRKVLRVFDQINEQAPQVRVRLPSLN